MANLRQALYAWRDQEAAKHHVDLFRILPNSALDQIVRTCPKTKEELTAIKGIKEAKYRQFGLTILSLVDQYAPGDGVKKAAAESVSSLMGFEDKKEEQETTYSVSDYLEIINRELYRIHARVRGEIVQYKIQGSALYFSIKDASDDSVLNVFMWLSDYSLSGIEIAEGMEVIITGRSEVYKPSGRLSFRTHTMEVVGEGALKKAYDQLKKKLDKEGLFAPERKRQLKDFPERIGLVTSKTGAVIHDFLNNLGKFGYHVSFVDSRVEGMTAVKDILGAIEYFKRQSIDALVVVRGGGSLESLQAFNNEHVVRAISEFPQPVICAIGHDKDVPLAQFVADYAPSTPTAATAILNRSWERAGQEVSLCERDIFGNYKERIGVTCAQLGEDHFLLSAKFGELLALFRNATQLFAAHLDTLHRALDENKREVDGILRSVQSFFQRAFVHFENSLRSVSAEIEAHNPLRQLKLGYSLLSQNGQVLRSVKNKRVGEHFHARLSDGTLEADIVGIKIDE